MASKKTVRTSKPRVGDEIKENLIDHVKECPFLWKKTHPQYADKIFRQDAWKRLDDTLNIDTQTTWRNLRNSYTQYRKIYEAESRSGAAASKRQKWCLWEKMTYFDEHIETRADLVERSYEEQQEGETAEAADEEDPEDNTEIDIFDEGEDLSIETEKDVESDALGRSPFVSSRSSSSSKRSSSTRGSHSTGRGNSSEHSFVSVMSSVIKSIKPPTLPVPNFQREPSDGSESLPKSIRTMVIQLGHLMHLFKLEDEPDLLQKFRDESVRRITELGDEASASRFVSNNFN